jgi:hypothetical protein
VWAVVRVAGDRIDHQFGIAVIGGDQQRPALGEDGIGDLSKAGIDRLDRLDRRREHAGVADHVGIGEVQHEEVVLPALDRGDDLARQLRRRHLRLQS